MGTSHDFSSVPENSWDGSKNAELSNNDAGWDAGTDRKGGNGRASHLDQETAPSGAPTEPQPEPEPEPGLSPWRIRELACWYIELADAKRQHSTDVPTAELDAALRQRLAGLGVFREFIEIEFQRVMEQVFA
jgi:hypothetical protein